MDYEKKYKDALERAKIELNADTTQGTKNVLMTVFPELKESEDEKIRKGIIDFLWKEKIFLQEAHSSVENNPKYRFVMDAIAWLEKRGEKEPIMNVPTREVILSIWDLGNEWKELTNGSISTEYGTQLDYIQKHWHESEYYLREKQGEQKPVNDTVETIVEAVSNTSILDMIEDKDAFTNSGAFENSLGRLLKLFEKLPKQDLLDGLKFYANVVEHDGEYVKPDEWSKKDEEIFENLSDYLENESIFSENEEDVTYFNEYNEWLKSLKERLI